MSNRKQNKSRTKHNTLALAKSIMYETSYALNKLNISPFGSEMPMDVSSVRDSLVVNRFCKKFAVGDPVDTRRVALDSYIEYDQSMRDFDLNLWDDLNVRKSRVLLHKWLKNFSYDIDDAMIEFSPGSSFETTQGEVSIIAKLSDKKHWTTTWNCLEDTVRLIYKNRILKYAARRHIGHVTRTERKKLFVEFRGAGKENFRFLIFRHLLISRVLTIYDGARAETVPKNALTDRFINVECMFPMILQRIIAYAIRTVLKKVGNAIDPSVALNNNKFGARVVSMDAQEVHKILIKDPRFATIDFSNASDSVLIVVIQKILPNVLLEPILRFRSNYVLIDGEIYQPYKVSSMGNGFTFELMTLILYALSSSYTPFSRVFGDDVIIPNDHAQQFIASCKLIGFTPNMKKTFISSPFRESCGAFYHDDHGYMKSYDFDIPEEISDIIVTCNKIMNLLDTEISYSIFEILQDCREALAALIPASQKGPIPDDHFKDSNLCYYLYDNNWKRKQLKLSSHTGSRKRAIDSIGDVTYLNLGISQMCFVRVLAFKPRRSKHTDPLLSYLLSIDQGRQYVGSVRGKGKWLMIDAFVDRCGRIFLLRTLRGRKTNVLLGGRFTTQFGRGNSTITICE